MNDEKPIITEELKKTALWHIISFTIIGMAVGFMSGASNSPIVATVLPLFFALIAGGGGVYLIKADIESKKKIWFQGLIAKSLTALFGSFVIALIIGIYVRMALPQTEKMDISKYTPQTALNNPQAHLSWALHRAKLSALGLSEQDIAFLTKSSKFGNRIKLSKNLGEKMTLLAENLEKLSERLKSVHEDNANLEKINTEDVFWIELLERAIHTVGGQYREGMDLPQGYIELLFNNLNTMVLTSDAMFANYYANDSKLKKILIDITVTSIQTVSATRELYGYGIMFDQSDFYKFLSVIHDKETKEKELKKDQKVVLPFGKKEAVGFGVFD
jgi:hypothetical protein